MHFFFILLLVSKPISFQSQQHFFWLPMRKKQNKMTKNKRMEATAVTMLHAASERADGNKAAMTEILFCLIRLIKPT